VTGSHPAAALRRTRPLTPDPGRECSHAERYPNGRRPTIDRMCQAGRVRRHPMEGTTRGDSAWRGMVGRADGRPARRPRHARHVRRRPRRARSVARGAGRVPQREGRAGRSDRTPRVASTRARPGDQPRRHRLHRTTRTRATPVRRGRGRNGVGPSATASGSSGTTAIGCCGSRPPDSSAGTPPAACVTRVSR
jgi:hypothetical protein